MTCHIYNIYFEVYIYIVVQVQPRKHVIDDAEYSAPTGNVSESIHICHEDLL